MSLFREYLRIKSVQPDPDYEGCMAFLKERARVMGLPYKIVENYPGSGRPDN